MPHDPASVRHTPYENVASRAVLTAPRPPAAVAATMAALPASLLRLSLGARLGVVALALVVLWTVVLLVLR